LKQAILQATGPVILPDFLPPAIRGEDHGVLVATATASPLEANLTEFIQERLRAGSTNLHAELFARVERHLLSEVLRHTGNNQSEAARILGVTRKTLRTRMAAFHLAVDHLTTLTE